GTASLREHRRLQRCALLRNQLLDLLHELTRGHVFGLLFPAGADVDLVGFGFFIAHHQQERYFLHRVLADFRVHLFVAGIDFHAHACRPQLRRYFSRILDMALSDWDHRYLHRREPHWERPGVVFDQHAEEALDRSVERAVHHQRLLTAAVFGNVFELEALRQVEVELHGRELPQASDGVDQLHVDLRTPGGKLGLELVEAKIFQHFERELQAAYDFRLDLIRSTKDVRVVLGEATDA